jgi:hypothetical protein
VKVVVPATVRVLGGDDPVDPLRPHSIVVAGVVEDGDRLDVAVADLGSGVAGFDDAADRPRLGVEHLRRVSGGVPRSSIPSSHGRSSYAGTKRVDTRTNRGD